MSEDVREEIRTQHLTPLTESISMYFEDNGQAILVWN